jgi:hypothetical protein
VVKRWQFVYKTIASTGQRRPDLNTGKRAVNPDWFGE